MTTILVAVDDPRRPKRSVVICGPEVPVDDCRRKFAELREAGVNPSGLPWVQLWSIEAPSIAHTPNKPKGSTK